MSHPATGTATAAVWHGPGTGFALERVRLPRLGADEALVEIDTVTLCGSDLHTVAGDRETALPTILGHEMVGTVAGVGGPVTAYDGRIIEPGTRITWTVGSSCGRCPRCVRGLPQKCRALRKYGHAAMSPDWRLNGGLASNCHLVGGTGIVVVPGGLDDRIAAPANCATATVVAACRRVEVTAADTVLVQGCGMLGLTAVGLLASRGVATIVCCDVDPARRELAGHAGGTATTHPDLLAETVREATGDEGVTVALDFTGNSPAVRGAIDQLAIGGRLGLVGSVSPAPTIELAPEDVVRRLLTVSGIHNYTAADLADAVDFLDTAADRELFGSFVPRTFGLSDISAAVAHAATERPPRVAVDPSR